jgi:hypothetical protein
VFAGDLVQLVNGPRFGSKAQNCLSKFYEELFKIIVILSEESGFEFEAGMGVGDVSNRTGGASGVQQWFRQWTGLLGEPGGSLERIIGSL